MKLSVVIPCYNEGQYIGDVLNRIMQVSLPVPLEIVIVDDGSSDDSPVTAEKYIGLYPDTPIRLIRHTRNSGKGSAIRTALESITGDVVIIQDADPEYDPSDYVKMLAPILNGHADVVYGSRFRGSEAHRVLFFWHTIGNKMLTFLSNMLTGLNLTDMETGYKMFRADLLRNIRLRENRFGFEPEITARISRIKGVRIYEVGISYYGRTYAEGKKINWKDGLKAIYCIIRYNLFPGK